MGKVGKVIMSVVGAVLGVVGLVTGPAWLGYVGAALMAAGGIGMPKLPKVSEVDFRQSGYLVNTKSMDESIALIFGEMRVGSNTTFMTSAGEENKELYCVLGLGRGPIESVERVYLNELESTDAFFSGHVSMATHLGTAVQTPDATLHAAFNDWNEAHRGVAHIVAKLTYNKDIFQSLPYITALVKGLLLYDPRDGLVSYSNNCALVILFFMIDPYDGIGIPHTSIDMTSVSDCANFCDTMHYVFNGVFKKQDYVQDLIDSALLVMRGYVIWTDGTFKLRNYQYGASVLSLTEENDIVDGSFEITVPGLMETPNRLKINYTEPSDNYYVASFMIDDASVLTADGLERLNEVNMIGCASREQAADLGAYLYKRGRFNKTFSFVARVRAIVLEAGDLIKVTHSTPGWDGRLCRVISLVYQPDYTVWITVMEEAPELYDSSTLLITPEEYYSGDFFDPNTLPPAVTSVEIVESLHRNKDMQYSRFSVTFSHEEWPWWDYAEVFVSIGDTSNWQHLVDTANNKFILEPVEDGVAYYFKIRGVSVYGKKEENLDNVDSWVKIVEGPDQAPADVEGFHAIASGDNINLKWDAIDAVDLAGFEIRLGTSWSASVQVATPASISTTCTLTGVRPGTHVFLIKAKNTYGMESVTPATCSVTVYYPPGYTDKHSFPDDFSDSAAEHKNTAYEDDSVLGRILYCTHGVYKDLLLQEDGGKIEMEPGDSSGYLLQEEAISLQGRYTSPSFDMGSIKTVRLWINFDLFTSGEETTWQGRFEADETWQKYTLGEYVDKPLDTWLKIFQAILCGHVTMELLYSSDGANWTAIPYFHIYAPEVSARYVRYRITINDVTEDNCIYVGDTTVKAAYWQ